MAWFWFQKCLGRVLGISVLVLVFAVPSPLAAQTSGVTLKVEPYLSGHFKYGEWLPLRVTLTNSGSAFSGQVRADSTQANTGGTWIVPVDLPAGAQKQVTLYVLPPNYALGMRVRLMSGTQEVEHQTVPLTLHPNTDYLVGVIATRTEPFAVLNGITLNAGLPRGVHMIPLQLGDVPDRTAGLGALNAIIITDVDTSGLSAEQRRTLANWVQNGGRLIVGGGASAARTLAGLPEAVTLLLRVQDNPIEVTTLEGLETFGDQPIRVPGPFVVNPAPANGALIVQAGQALIAEHPLGEGTIAYSALDLSASPFDAWAGAEHFWQKLLTPGSMYPPNMPGDVSPDIVRIGSMTQTLQYMPVLALPSLNILAPLLILYIVLVGPLNYIVLRRFKKLDWGWLTIPGLTCLFAVGAFALSNQLRGGDIVLNTLSVASLYADGTAASLKTYVGIFSPTRDTFILRIPGQALVIPISNGGDPFGRGGSNTGTVSSEVVTGDPTVVNNVQINQGALQTFAIESDMPPNWGIESDLRFDETHLGGSIINHLNEPLSGVSVVNGDRFTILPDLAPGENRNIEATWQPYSGSLSNAITGSGIEAEKRRQALNNYFASWNGPKGQVVPRPLLLGWLSHSPLDVQVANRGTAQQESTLVVATLHLSYTSSTVLLRANDWSSEPVESTGNQQMCGAANFVGVGAGSLILRFRPLIPLALKANKLTIQVEQGNPVEIELESLSGEWVKMDTSKASGQLPVPDPARYVTPDGTVRLRLTNDHNNQQCALYNLELEGGISP